MFRPLVSLAIAVSIGASCLAQQPTNVNSEAGGNPGYIADFNPAGVRVTKQVGQCSYAAEVISPLGSIILYMLNFCTHEVRVLGYYLTPPSSAQGSAVANAAQTAGTTAGATVLGSEGITSVTLAGGRQLVVWVVSTGISTGVVTGSGNVQVTGQYTSGPTPEDVITADFNGDGNADLAVSSFGNLSNDAGGNVAIFLGHGDGTFTRGSTINTPTAVALYAADFNGDGKMDLAVANVDPADTISVFLGNGDGTFRPPVSYPVPISPTSVLATDFNGDGRLDLAVANGYSGGISILLGNGDGTFQAAKGYPSGIGQSFYLASTDLNGDGKLDLIVANPQSSGVSFLFGNGDGSFQAPVQYATGAQSQYFGLIQSSGQVWIATADAISGDICFMRVAPNGVAAGSPIYRTPQTASGIAAADLNGDGYPDIVAADQSLTVMLRNPGGAFQTPVSYTLQSGSKATSVAVSDLNGDGKNDVVASSVFTDQFGNYGGTVDVVFGNGNGTLGAQASYPIGGFPGGGSFGAYPSGIAIGDFTGDGKPDVAAAFQAQLSGSGAGGVSVLINSGNGTLRSAVNYSVGSFSVTCMLAGDFNGDGKLDLAACGNVNSGGFTPGALGILLGKGDGTFQNAALTQVGTPAGALLALAAGDLNGDGKLDLVATIQDASFHYSIVALLGNGNGTFRQLSPLASSVSGSAVALLDLNGDGIPDLVVGDCCGLSESVYLLGNGDGTFQSPQYFSSGSGVVGFAVTSWNHDGVAGLAIAGAQGTGQSGAVEALESTLNPRLYASAPTLSVVSSHTGNFAQGQVGASYTITVSNAVNAAPAAGVVTVNDTAPFGLTITNIAGTGWNCSGHTCTISGALAGGYSYSPITVNVNVSANATSPAVNMVSVSGGGSAAASGTDPTNISSAAIPSLGITSSHTGNFTQGQQGATYTLTVSNTAGAAPTSGTVTVTETLPSGLTLVSMSGTGWSCSAAVCTRSDVLAAGSSYPTITVTVNVAANATSPLVNAVSVSGGGSAAASATDSTIVTGGVTSGLALYPITPCRIADTRASGGMLSAGSTRSFTIAGGACGAPIAQAYSLNITVVPPGPMGYLTAWPTGQAQPLVSVLNSYNGVVIANAAIVPAGPGGSVSIYASDQTHVIIDINGYFAAPGSPGALAFYPATPCRIADTRATTPLPAGGTRSFNIPQSSCHIPAAAQGFSLNMTAVPPGPLGYLTTWPAGQPQPVVSTLNANQGQIAANAAIVPAGTGGAVSVFVSDTTNVIIDINGYFAPPGSPGALYFHPVAPCRIADTRGAAGTFGGPLLGTGSSRPFPIPASSCNLPSTAQAWSLNMTVVPPGPLVYLTTWPAGQPLPVVSTLNDIQGQVVANAAIVPAGTSGGISVFVSDATNLIIDVNGYFGQ